MSKSGNEVLEEVLIEANRSPGVPRIPNGRVVVVKEQERRGNDAVYMYLPDEADTPREVHFRTYLVCPRIASSSLIGSAPIVKKMAGSGLLRFPLARDIGTRNGGTSRLAILKQKAGPDRYQSH